MLCQLSYTHHSFHTPSVFTVIVSLSRSYHRAPEGIRTPDPRLRRPLLYPPELLAPNQQRVRKHRNIKGRVPPSLAVQSGRLDLNQRPPAPKAGALPGCATPRQMNFAILHAKDMKSEVLAESITVGSSSARFLSALPRWLTAALVARSISPKVLPKGG